MAEFGSYAPGTPCWIDVTSTDMERTNAFYGELFGWRAEPATQTEAGGYTMYTLNGKYVAAGSPPPGAADVPPHWTTYLASDDVDATAAKIGDAGGTLYMEPFDVFDAGRMVVAADPTGTSFAVWQAGRHTGAQLANEPGTLSWNECRSPDPARAAEFYAAAFGHTVEALPMGDTEEYRVLQVDGRGIAAVAPAQEGEAPSWLTVFASVDCDETAANARELGGGVLVEPFEIPDVGRYAVLRDPLGAVFGVLSSPA